MISSEVPCCPESLHERAIEGRRKVVGSVEGGTGTNTMEDGVMP